MTCSAAALLDLTLKDAALCLIGLALLVVWALYNPPPAPRALEAARRPSAAPMREAAAPVTNL